MQIGLNRIGTALGLIGCGILGGDVLAVASAFEGRVDPLSHLSLEGWAWIIVPAVVSFICFGIAYWLCSKAEQESAPKHWHYVPGKPIQFHNR